jgi:hypothetical protein
MQQKKIMLSLGILTSTFILTACGGGKESAATQITPPATVKTEVINGQTVPLAPDPTLNNSTLVGVDSNNNGVRDDVERLIAITNNKSLAKEVEVAKYAQIAVSSKNKDALFDFQCALESLNVQDRPILQNAIFNNKARRELYNALDTPAGELITFTITSTGVTSSKECRIYSSPVVE